MTTEKIYGSWVFWHGGERPVPPETKVEVELVRTGDDEFMLVTYKNAKAQCDGGKCGIGGYCDDCPTPQADSQPAPVEVVDAMAQQWVPCLLEIDAIRAGATERGE